MMKFFFKLISCCCGLAITLWGFSTDISDRLDGRSAKIADAKIKEVRVEIANNRQERIARIVALDNELKTEIGGLKTQMKEANELLRVLVRRSNKEYVFKRDTENRFNESI